MRDLQLHLDAQESVGPNGIHPILLRELADGTARPLSVLLHLFGNLERSQVWNHWKLVNIAPVFQKTKQEDPGNYRPVSHTSVPGRTMEKILLGVTEKLLKDNAVMGHSQHTFTKGRSHLTNLISFYDKVTHLDDQGKPLTVIA